MGPQIKPRWIKHGTKIHSKKHPKFSRKCKAPFIVHITRDNQAVCAMACGQMQSSGNMHMCRIIDLLSELRCKQLICYPRHFPHVSWFPRYFNSRSDCLAKQTNLSRTNVEKIFHSSICEWLSYHDCDTCFRCTFDGSFIPGTASSHAFTIDSEIRLETDFKRFFGVVKWCQVGTKIRPKNDVSAKTEKSTKR